MERIFAILVGDSRGCVMKRFGLSVLVLVILGPVIADACFAQAQQPSPQQQAQPPQNQIAPQSSSAPAPPQEDTPATVAAIDTPAIVTDSSVDRSKIVFVSDFELDA